MRYEDMTPEERRDVAHDIRDVLDAARRQKYRRIEYGPEALRILVDNKSPLIIRIYGDVSLMESDTTLSEPDLERQVGEHVRTERVPGVDDEHA